MIKKTAVEHNVALVKEVILFMCRKPELLRFNAFDTKDSIIFEIIAHPNDAKMLVGADGAHISALSKLSQLLFFHFNKIVYIPRIESLDGYGLDPKVQFESKSEWREKEIVDLAARISKACFPCATISVSTIDRSKTRSALLIKFALPQDEIGINKLSRSIGSIIYHIGAINGREIVTDIINGCQPSQ